MAEMPAKIGMQSLIRVEPEELADDLDRQDLAVCQHGCRSALAQSAPAIGVANEIVR